MPPSTSVDIEIATRSSGSHAGFFGWRKRPYGDNYVNNVSVVHLTPTAPERWRK